MPETVLLEKIFCLFQNPKDQWGKKVDILHLKQVLKSFGNDSSRLWGNCFALILTLRGKYNDENCRLQETEVKNSACNLTACCTWVCACSFTKNCHS